MVAGYQNLLAEIYTLKSDRQQAGSLPPSRPPVASGAGYADAT
jgi:hypothetical protein